jgi:hypothetical protein
MSAEAQLSALSEHGIVTDLARLWALVIGPKAAFFHAKAARNLLLGNVRSRFRGRGVEFERLDVTKLGTIYAP